MITLVKVLRKQKKTQIQQIIKMYYLYLTRNSESLSNSPKSTQLVGAQLGQIINITQVVSREASILTKNSFSFHHIIPPLFF